MHEGSLGDGKEGVARQSKQVSNSNASMIMEGKIDANHACMPRFFALPLQTGPDPTRDDPPYVRVLRGNPSITVKGIPMLKPKEGERARRGFSTGDRNSERRFLAL